MQIPEHKLIPYIQKWVDLLPEEEEKILSAFEPVELEKKKLVLKPGEISKHIYFIVKGVLRSYFVDEKGVEHIYQIRLENGWIGDLESFFSQNPAKFYIETLEASLVLQISNGRLEQLYAEVPKLERYFRILFQKAYINALQRLNSTMWTTAEERYQDMVKENCDILQRVPQAYIASYLGITPESLSRIRKKKS
ncbi:Crp/Fnr family transcriptional regulator [Algoriphagus aestuariicola]|uniref:Crp/Fnr family transcriptional regulator n=1 Tax=Algoriphagus aestuariicola TaxID=1852016 RepID=A0ABS3BK80_9BACT|nr:Crp/Fnr family transcriptional regulator [Algoriphagus aestuariicola]MBN7799708.1 Crp/Fnr family transcriptional regulator [Algoriphagus aestuariicola]